MKPKTYDTAWAVRTKSGKLIGISQKKGAAACQAADVLDPSYWWDGDYIFDMLKEYGCTITKIEILRPQEEKK